jgi:ribulose-bisphosphate carboxylase large chain
VDGYVGGPGMITTARRQFPNQYLHYHRAGHGAVTSPSAKRGYTAYVLAKMSRLQGASGIHVGTMGYGKMEGERTTAPSPTSSSATATPARPTTRSGTA